MYIIADSRILFAFHPDPSCKLINLEYTINMLTKPIFRLFSRVMAVKDSDSLDSLYEGEILKDDQLYIMLQI